MIKKNVILALAVAVLAAGLLTAQKTAPFYEIKGTVLDNSGNPLIGASIRLKNSALGAVADLDGSFMLTVQDSCVMLEVFYTGYLKKEEKACFGSLNAIVLEEDTRQLEEVIVMAYGVQTRRANTGAPRQRKARDSKKAPSYYKIGSDSPQAEAFQTEDYSRIQENRFHRATQEPQSTFSIDVDAASYTNMRRFINLGQFPPKDAVRIEEMINFFEYDYPEPTGKHPFSIIAEVSDCPWQPKHRLVHIGLQGRTIPQESLPPSNLVFLIDVSGSMNEPNKLPLVQASFRLLVEQLRPQDRVAIVVYASASGLVLGPTPGNEKQKILQAIDNLSAGGSTAGGQGIQLAYKTAREHFINEGNNRVILATDGDFNVGVSSDGQLVELIEKERKSGVFLTVLGYGMGNYQDSKMQQLADSGNGNHAYIDNLDEAQRVLVREFGGTLFTIAKDVKLQLEFNPAEVEGYRLIGYENRMLENEDFEDDQKDAGELGAGHTVTALYELIPAGVESPFLASGNDLKYQQRDLTPQAKRSNELLTVKFRYKAPDSDTSELLEEVVADKKVALDHSSDNFRWSAAVASFGMLLRHSEFKGNSTYETCKSLAQSAKGKDPDGYRAEMIRLINAATSLDKTESGGR